MSHIPENFRRKIQEAKENQLKVLDLSSTYNTEDQDKLTKIPDEVFGLTQLEVLILTNNKINKVPESIGNLTNLQQLVLSDNCLSYLPVALSRLNKLQWLDLKGNHLPYISAIFINSSLKSLYLGNNKLLQFPDEVCKLTQLEVLDLTNNRINKLPESIGNLTNLQQLVLSDNCLSYLPVALSRLNKLQWVDLRGNKLSYIPRIFKDLRWLDLGKNEFLYIPEFIKNLTNLEHLYLADNQLEDVPSFIGNLDKLIILSLQNNKICTFTNALANLTNLKKLYLANNQLSSLPESIINLVNLEYLDLEDNQLKSLPESIDKLNKLKELNFRNNKLTDLPESIKNLPKSTKITATGNPIVVPPIEVVEEEQEAFRDYYNYFRQIEEEGGDKIYEAKLMIVGQAGAGKTTLAKKIEDPNYDLDPDESTTEGIDIIKWKFKFDNNQKEFTVNIWDFAGQEIYRHTHRFFLSQNSLYIVVIDNRNEDFNLYYWLNIVEKESENSPVLIIQNEKQNLTKELDKSKWRGQFNSLQNILATNLKTDTELTEILADIKHYIQKLNHIGKDLPKTWVKVRQVLEADQRNSISLDEFKKICQTNGISIKKDQLQLSKYLHDIGVCLHFQNEKRSRLYETVILKPEWGTNAVYKVLDNDHIKEKHGRFTESDLENIWHEQQYQGKQWKLLDLMIKFQLCYKIPDNKNIFIAPQLISNIPPQYDWDESNNLILRYIYPDFMPEGIITNLIVVMHEQIEQVNQQQYVWKSGVILKKDQARAKVIENIQKREIVIRVRGNNKRELLTLISHQLDKVNNSYKELKHQMLVPCNCKCCIDSHNPYAYEFKKLVERIDNNKLTIPCDNPPYEEIQVLDLIYHAIDIKQLISEDKKDTYNYVFTKKIENIIDISRKLDMFGNAKVNNSGAGAFNLGDINGILANTINQLPNFENEPNKKQLKELFGQIESVVLDAQLDEENSQETLENIKVIAEALQDSQDRKFKRRAKSAMLIIQDIADELSPNAKMGTISNQLQDLVSRIF